MYYKLPIKDRMDLMKSYKKANPKMSYSDMVNDYNTSYQKFDNGGKKDNTNVVINNGVPVKSIEAIKSETLKEEAQKNYVKSDAYYKDLRKELDSIQTEIPKLGLNPFQFYKMQQRAGEIFKTLGEKKPELVKKEINNGQKAGKIIIASSKYLFPPIAPLTNAVEGGLSVYDYVKNPDTHNTASLMTEAAPFINNKYSKAYQVMGDYLTGQEAGLFPEDKHRYGGVQQFGDGGKLSYPQKVQAYNDSTILFKSGFNKNIPNQIYEPQFNAAKKRLTELNKKEPQSTDYYRSYANNPEYLKKYSVPYAKPTYPKKDTVLPEKKEKTRTDIYTNKELFDKAYKAETDSSNAYNSTVKVLSSLDKWNKDKSEKNKKEYWKDQNKNLDLTNSQKLNGVSENKIIKPIKTEWSKQNAPDGDIDFYNVYKKPVVHNVYQPPELPEKMIPIEARVPKDIVEPGLKTVPKDFGYRRIGWRNDPNTNLQVPVLLTHPKMKVKQGERIYNKEIPTSTMGIPKDWEAEFSKPEKTEKTDTYWRRK
jgi:hypothetical protein